MKPVHPLIQEARGLCSDGAPHEEIEALLARAVDAVKDLEDALRPFPRGVVTHSTPRRPGGRQVSYARGVRILAAFLVDEGYVASESRAQRVASRWLRAALPERQKAPRKRPASDLREAA